jgi:hypothetical protein
LCLCSRDLREACDVWEEILLDYPHDALAIKLVQDGYYHLGEFARLRDCIARILPEWSATMPLYGYLLGLYSFGLCETGNYSQAGIYARKVIFNQRNMKCIKFDDVFHRSLLLLEIGGVFTVYNGSNRVLLPVRLFALKSFHVFSSYLACMAAGFSTKQYECQVLT